MYYYILVRNDEFCIVGVPRDCDPLYGRGSWDKYAGPFYSWEAAEEAVPAQEMDYA
jgi:hypothetical protein